MHIELGNDAVDAPARPAPAEPVLPARGRHNRSSAADRPRSLLPDAADQTLPNHAGVIDWVGMEDIRMPVRFDGGDGVLQCCNAHVDAFVNLIRPDRRGIHMSRLYLLADRHLGAQAIDPAMLEALLHAFVQSHAGLADRARLGIRFEHLVRRQSLRSGHKGWRAYPVRIDANLVAGDLQLELGTEITYSSTCPASAALSRQLIQDRFAHTFVASAPLDHASVLAWLGNEHGIVATPHAQRSAARLRVRFVPGVRWNLVALLDRVEQALGTPVQAAVKREDEQAFALANGSNPMFCEDAVRRIQHALESCADVAAFDIRVEHRESLHPHNAVARTSRDSRQPAAPCGARGDGHG